mgnify:CR=1 FL=1
MKNILVLGASGMAGHVIFTFLTEKNCYNVLGTTNSTNFLENTLKLDVFDNEKLIGIIDSFKPDFVINCVGMLISSSKDFPDKTIYTNSYFPHLLAKLSFAKDFKLVHISTDCVFSGKTGNYIEESIKDALDVYGLSKSLGEINDTKNLTIRTSIIGPEIKSKGEGLFHWIMNQYNDVFGFKSNFWSGVTTLELAKFIDYVVHNDLIGLFHLTNNIAISKFELLNIINDIFNLGLIISDTKDYKCDKSFINTNKEVLYSVPSYWQMLVEQKEFMNLHDDFYKHYS